MKKYEAIVILDDRKVDANGAAYVKSIEEVIAQLGGANVTSECMGRKQFAYPINKKNAGTYWDLIFDLNEDAVEKLVERYRLVQEVLRLVVFAYERPEKTCLENIKADAE